MVITKNTAGNYRIGQNGNTSYARIDGDFLADGDNAEAGYDFRLITINATLEQTIADAQALIATASTVATKAAAPQVQAAITAAQAAIAASATQAELYDAWNALNAAEREYNYASMKSDAGKIAISSEAGDFFYTIGDADGCLFTVTPDTLLAEAPVSLGTLYHQVFKFIGYASSAKIVDLSNNYYIGKVGDAFTMVSTADSASEFALLRNLDGSYTMKDKAGVALTLDGSKDLFVSQYTTADALSVAIDSATVAYNTTKDGVTKGFYLTADRAALKSATEVATEIRNNNLITDGEYYTTAFNTLKTAIETYFSKQISGLLYSTEAQPVWFFIANQAGDARQNMLLTADGVNPLYAAPAVYTANQMWRIETSVADSAYLINRATGAKIAIVSDYADRNWTPIINQATYAGDVANTTVAAWKVINNGNETYSFTYTVDTENYNFSLNSTVEEGTNRYAIIGSNDQTDPSFNWTFVNAFQDDASLIDSVNVKLAALIAFGDGIVNAEAVNAAKEVFDNPASNNADFIAAYVAFKDAYVAFKAASFAQLDADITEATMLLSTISQGTEPNQASKSARTALQSAIANANSVKSNINNGKDFYSNGILFESIAKTEAAIAKFRAKVVKSAELEALILECTDLINAAIAAGGVDQTAINVFQAAIDKAGLAATAEECAEQLIALTAARDEFKNYYDSVDGISAAGLNIYTSEKAIVVEGAEGAITITTPAGVSYQVEAQNVTTITIEAAGVYYVTANGKTVAVAVK